LQLHLYLKLRSKSKPWNAIPIHYPTPSLRATVAYPTALLTLLPCPNGLPISNSFSYGYSCSPYGVSYSAASPEFLNNDQTPPLPAIAALLPAFLTALPTLLLSLNALPKSLTATAALSYGPSYSAASPECLTSNQFHLLQLLLLFLTALLTLLLHLNALPVTKSISYSCCCSFLRPYLLCCFT